MRYEVRLSGSGGQGVVLAGIILAEAAGIYEGLHVVQTVSYGPQVRGGMSNADVVISDEEIDYPKAISLDLLVVLSQEACDANAGDVKEDGMILLDRNSIVQLPSGWLAPLPLTELALQVTGREQMANIVALGAISALVPHVSPGSMERAVMERAPSGLGERFQKAFATGLEAGEGIRGRLIFEGPPVEED